MPEKVIDDDSELHENYFEGLSYHYLKDRDPVISFWDFGGVVEILVPNFHISSAGLCNVEGLEYLGGIQLFVAAHLHM